MKTFVAAAALALAAPAAAQMASAPVFPITLYSFGYSPRPIVLRAGRPVTLVLTNRAGIGHTFTAPYFFRTSRILSGYVDGGKIEIAPHRSTSVTLIPVRGSYEVHCSHFMHEQLGMQTRIYVE